jgi:RimJ/RimL family protein N-acetyltransferase
VGPGPVLASHGVSPGALAAQALRSVGGGAQGDRRVPGVDRPRRAGGVAWMRARLDALARRWWGQGYATEGARAALAHASTVLGKERIISLIHPENRASIRVAERIGERLQGRVQHLGREMLCYGVGRESLPLAS